MSTFATELPVKATVRREQFFAAAIAWVKGMNNCDLFLGNNSETERAEDHALITSASGQSFAMKEVTLEDGFVLGARYETPDDEGLLWRSEIVLTNRADRAALRIKGQCLAIKQGASPRQPKPPYFIKIGFDDRWYATDDGLPISQQPHNADDIGLASVAAALNGESKQYLPVVYLSKSFSGEAAREEKQAKRLAFRLGGIAHVIYEPSVDFSEALMEETGGRNPYNGTVGLVAPGHGIVNRFYLGPVFETPSSVERAVSIKATEYASSRQARSGWDWQDLLEEASKQMRKRIETGSEEHDLWEQLRTEEQKEKDEVIAALKSQISELQGALERSSTSDGSILSAEMSRAFGPQLYPGEFSDRVRLSLKQALETPSVDLDPRTRILVEKLVRSTQNSGGAKGLQSRIKAAGRDTGTADKRLIPILQEMGFTKRQDGGHPVMTPPHELFGIEGQTFSSSGSDWRAGKNKSSQLINGLHLKNLLQE